jgi:outer membrane protein assembly factor BamB
LRAVCINRDTGRIVHNVEVFQLADPGPVHQKNGHASPTPIIEGDRIYLLFGSHGTACITRSGQIVWKTQELEALPPPWARRSPVVYGDSLIVSCDGYDIQFVALDKRTGKIRWKSPRKGYRLYHSVDDSSAGKDQLISPGAHRRCL